MNHNSIKAELKMNLLREREEKDNLERQLIEEQKIRVLVQKRLRREKRTRRQLQAKLDLENKRRMQLEEALRAAGSAEQVTLINEKLDQSDQRPTSSSILPVSSSSNNQITNLSNQPRLITPPQSERPDHLAERPVERIKQEREDPPGVGYGQQTSKDIREPPPPQIPQENKPWAYSGLELMNTGAAFWQNYSDTLAQELEMERKSRQQHMEREVKSPLQDRSGYYKNSVMFTSSAT